MKLLKIVFILSLISLFSSLIFAQTNPKTKPLAATFDSSNQIKSSPAYAEVLLRKTELLSELESLLVEYTEDYPKVKELRFETGSLQKELDTLLAINPSESSKLSAALGKLMVRKCELSTDLWTLQKEFNDQHPNVKRAKRRLEIFEASIKDILQTK
jgi:uncharacterized protein involved in exopolysaccharide biosynthesis